MQRRPVINITCNSLRSSALTHCGNPLEETRFLLFDPALGIWERVWARREETESRPEPTREARREEVPERDSRHVSWLPRAAESQDLRSERRSPVPWEGLRERESSEEERSRRSRQSEMAEERRRSPEKAPPEKVEMVETRVWMVERVDWRVEVKEEEGLLKEADGVFENDVARSGWSLGGDGVKEVVVEMGRRRRREMTVRRGEGMTALRR